MSNFTKIICSLWLLILNITIILSEETILPQTCEMDNDQYVVEWYSRVYNFARINQNLTQHMLQLNIELQTIKSQLDDTQRQLKEQQLKWHSSSNDNEIVIQRRQDGSVDFDRPWEDYKQGFGNTTGEFFIGLDKLHKLTNTRPYGLLVVMEDWENQRRYASYDSFAIGSELEKYPLQSLGTYKGTAGESLAYHTGFKFSTKDQDNTPKAANCAVAYRGAWWHNACHVSNLNGLYLKGTIGGPQWAQGIIWKSFKDYTYSLKFVEMILIRS